MAKKKKGKKKPVTRWTVLGNCKALAGYRSPWSQYAARSEPILREDNDPVDHQQLKVHPSKQCPCNFCENAYRKRN